MKLGSALIITVTALNAHKTRSFLASLGIMIGIASVIIMVAIGRGSQQEVMDVIAGMGENLITINAGEMKRRGGRLRLTGNVTTLNLRDVKRIADEVEEIEMVAPYEFKEMQVKFGNNAAEIRVAGSTGEFLRIRGYEVHIGEFFSERDLKAARRVAVIGQTAVKNLFGEEDPMDRTIKIKRIPFKVIGIFAPKGLDTDGQDQDDLILVPVTTLMRRVLNQTFITTIYVRAVSRKEIPRAVDKIREVLRLRHKLIDERMDDFTVITQLDIEDLKKETTELFTKLIVGVAAISLVVSGVGVLAVMLISVKERTREIGVRRAVGASRSDIVKQFLLESVLIGLLGGGIGISLGIAITLGLTTFGPWTLILDNTSIWVAAGICLLIGMVFGIFPALKASKLNPMEALTVE